MSKLKTQPCPECGGEMRYQRHADEVKTTANQKRAASGVNNAAFSPFRSVKREPLTGNFSATWRRRNLFRSEKSGIDKKKNGKPRSKFKD